MTKFLGPWTGEVGFELASWIPFVTWQIEENGWDDCVAISRGGTDAWYPCPVVNAYDVVTLGDFNRGLVERKHKTGNYKQTCPTDVLDTIILQRLGVYSSLHPSQMWAQMPQQGISLFGAAQTLLNQYRTPAKPVERLPELPEEYEALRFYQNAFLFQNPHYTSDLPIVMLKPRTQLDDHSEVDNVFDILVEYDAKDSFEIITRVVAHAKKFVCTYGGLAWLGDKCGVNTVGISNYDSKWYHAWMEPFPRVVMEAPNVTVQHHG